MLQQPVSEDRRTSLWGRHEVHSHGGCGHRGNMHTRALATAGVATVLGIVRRRVDWRPVMRLFREIGTRTASMIRTGLLGLRCWGRSFVHLRRCMHELTQNKSADEKQNYRPALKNMSSHDGKRNVVQGGAATGEP